MREGERRNDSDFQLSETFTCKKIDPIAKTHEEILAGMPMIVDCLSSSHFTVKMNSASLVAKLGSKVENQISVNSNATKSLIRLIADPSISIKSESIRALANLASNGLLDQIFIFK